MDNFDQWLAHTLSARAAYPYEPIQILVRVPIHLVPDGVSCSPTADGNFGRIKTLMVHHLRTYPSRIWISNHPNESHLTKTLLYTNYVFLDMNEAQQLGVINGNS